MRKSIMLVSSAGGHFNELQKLSVFNDPNNVIVTEKKGKLQKNIQYLKYGTRENKFIYPLIMIYNFCKAFYLLIKFRPKIIISTGAHTCVSFFLLAKLVRAKTIYIESFAKVYTSSLTYKIIKNFCDIVIVQNEELLPIYQNAIYLGSVY